MAENVYVYQQTSHIPEINGKVLQTIATDATVSLLD